MADITWGGEQTTGFAVQGQVVQMRLNGWQRIGVVLSVLWLVFVFGLGVCGYLDLPRALGPFVRIAQPPDAPISAPRTAARHENRTHAAIAGTIIPYSDVSPIQSLNPTYEFNFPGVLLAAFIPLVLGWTIAIVLVKTIRWIHEGFTRN
jgi:hypothetical protein